MNLISGDEAGWNTGRTDMRTPNFSNQYMKRRERRCMNDKFLKVEDVMQILGISKSAAYKIMRQMNGELTKKGYAVIRGKISRKYFEERFYGMTEEV